MRVILLLNLLMLTCTQIIGQSNHPEWSPVCNNIWNHSIKTKETFTILDAAQISPKLDRLNESEAQDFPLNPLDIEVNKQGDVLYLKFPLEKGEQIYGLGLQFKSVNQRGKIYNLRVDHYAGIDNGRTHAPVPFYISSKGYGVLINSAANTTFYVGTAVRRDSPNTPTIYDRNTDEDWSAQPESDMIEVMVHDSDAEIIVFNGTSPLDVVRKYNLYSGGGCLPPKWGLGFTYRTEMRFSDTQVLEEVEGFEEKGFPLDFIGLEPGWMSSSYPCTYEWDEGRFPEPEKFMKSLLDKGVKTNIWMNPYIAPQARLYEPMLPFAGSHTVWNGIVPDYGLDGARQVFADHFNKALLGAGVSGVKIDEVDGYDNWLWPDIATFPSGIPGEQMRLLYGLFMQTMISDLYKDQNQRTYGLTRASNAGASRFPFVLYNDYYKHEDFITALINSGTCGVLWTPEVRSSPSGEEWLRRMQSVCFSPMAMINAWSSGTKPWTYPEVYDAVKDIALLRMQLLPYIYSTFAEYHFDGTPPIRPMQLLEGFVADATVTKGKIDDTKNPYAVATTKDIKDQFMFGEGILVAPVFAGQRSRDVILPKGKWYDFYTGSYAGENEIITVATPLEKIPLFVKDGGVIPMAPPMLHTPSFGEKVALEVRHYGKSSGSFMLYDDDGQTFDYEKGQYSWTKITVDPKEKVVGQSIRVQGTIFNYENIKYRLMTP